MRSNFYFLFFIVVICLFCFIFYSFVWDRKKSEMSFWVLKEGFSHFVSFSLCDPDIRRFLQSRLRV